MPDISIFNHQKELHVLRLVFRVCQGNILRKCNSVFRVAKNTALSIFIVIKVLDTATEPWQNEMSP
jgi:hypothetical protein